MKSGKFLLGALAFVAASAGYGADQEMAPTVTISHFEFGPKNIAVPAGATVTWVNKDSFSHQVTIDGVMESQSLVGGSSFQQVFSEPGTYPYHCGVHKFMQGVVTVVAADGTVPEAAVKTKVEVSASAQLPSAASAVASASGTTAVSINNQMQFEPATLTVSAGSEVTWTNNDGSNHIIAFSDGQRSPRLRMGATFSRQFSKPGEYSYDCAIHGKRMSGKVIVTE